eukprot:1129649-Rhodomonas_salina.1
MLRTGAESVAVASSTLSCGSESIKSVTVLPNELPNGRQMAAQVFSSLGALLLVFVPLPSPAVTAVKYPEALYLVRSRVPRVPGKVGIPTRPGPGTDRQATWLRLRRGYGATERGRAR